ncbi:MAG: hypothetical protein WCV62_03250 [Candidatus Peribacteraceae bacterium]|jgi:hypothetical protein
MDRETAEALGPEVAEKISRLLERYGVRFYVCLAPPSGPDAETGSRIGAVRSREREPIYGMNAEDCERDQFRGETKGPIWREDGHFL